MSLEIKFRAWIHEPNREPQMVGDVGIIPEGKRREDYPMSISSTGIYVNPYCDWIELMQFTGFKDKNGKEIYEGDILRDYCEITDDHCTYIAKWDDEHSGFFAEDIIDPGCSLCFSQNSHWEVMGNIHENRELLEE